MATRTQIEARNRATAKRLAAVSGRDPLTAIRRLDARELFAVLSAKREESRPVTQERVVIGHDLRADDLHERDVLIRAQFPSWGGHITLTRFVVTKVTKTQLHLLPEWALEEGPKYITKVIIRNGIVSDDLVGESRSYRNNVYLYREGNPDLAKFEKANHAVELASKASLAVDNWMRSRSDLDRAKAVRDAFDVWITAAEADDADE